MSEVPEFIRERGEQMYRDLMRGMLPPTPPIRALDPFAVKPLEMPFVDRSETWKLDSRGRCVDCGHEHPTTNHRSEAVHDG